MLLPGRLLDNLLSLICNVFDRGSTMQKFLSWVQKMCSNVPVHTVEFIFLGSWGRDFWGHLLEMMNNFLPSFLFLLCLLWLPFLFLSSVSPKTSYFEYLRGKRCKWHLRVVVRFRYFKAATSFMPASPRDWHEETHLMLVLRWPLRATQVAVRLRQVAECLLEVAQWLPR